MDRITERLARFTGIVAELLAIAVAVGLQLDAFDLLRGGSMRISYGHKPGAGIAKIPGIALSAILLALGAPSRYNALKNLAGLQPALARRQ
jgi:hypothetical protein